MARFDRKVNRNKQTYSFTHKEVEMPDTSFKGVLKQNFTFNWMAFTLPAVVAYVLSFVATTLIVVPALMKLNMPEQSAFMIGHAFITGLLIVVINIIVKKEKNDAKTFMLRYAFMILLLGITSFLSLTITSWLS